jgi:hypothetical protein
VSTAKFLDLVNPKASYSCPDYGAFYHVAGYVFQPTSEIAATYGCLGGNSCGSEPLSAGVTVTGYWNESGALMSFPGGTYTVLAEDEWGAAVFAYFTIS